MLTKQQALEKIEELLAKANDLKKYVEGCEKETNKYPEEGTMYWVIAGGWTIDNKIWQDYYFDREYFDCGNFFLTEQSAKNEVLRRKSRKEAWIPKSNDDCWYWDFGEIKALEIYNMCDDYKVEAAQIGNYRKTKEECEDWSKVYAEAFLKGII